MRKFDEEHRTFKSLSKVASVEKAISRRRTSLISERLSAIKDILLRVGQDSQQQKHVKDKDARVTYEDDDDDSEGATAAGGQWRS